MGARAASFLTEELLLIILGCFSSDQADICAVLNFLFWLCGAWLLLVGFIFGGVATATEERVHF